jgi:transposase
VKHMIHIAAVTQTRLNRRSHVLPTQASRREETTESHAVPQRRNSDTIYRQPVADAECAALAAVRMEADAGPEGNCGASQESSAVDLPRTSTLRISHFPDPQ